MEGLFVSILFKTYDNLISELAILNIRLNSYIKQKEVLKELINKSSIDTNNQYTISYQSYSKELSILDSHIYLHQVEIKRLEEEKEEVNNLFSMLKGTEEQIFYYRVIKGLTQERTAERMYMSIRQVQRLEKKIKEKII
jgi:DNA-directed RNA polymerase specialized sigma24 family protein